MTWHILLPAPLPAFAVVFIPNTKGVTTPMTYFGMWRSFFAWHKEDADLYSINFLHWGAPKIWYAVAPSNAPKFDRMAQVRASRGGSDRGVTTAGAGYEWGASG